MIHNINRYQLVIHYQFIISNIHNIKINHKESVKLSDLKWTTTMKLLQVKYKHMLRWHRAGNASAYDHQWSG